MNLTKNQYGCKACPCRRFEYIPSRPEECGEWWLPRRKGFDVREYKAKCKCKHSHLEHDCSKFHCKVCGCGRFRSAFLCVVCEGHSEDHETIWETEKTLLVVDQPNTPNLNEVRALASYKSNRLVRVHVQEANAGASFARNTGLAQSFGDYAVLLDDDVIPEPGLLDAYLSAIARHPGEAVYVGVTNLPDPETWVECALVACRICYFYGIAKLQPFPPWGVTANMCVRSRTLPRKFVPFRREYPRTGGGEDVDFCIRSTGAGHGRIIAVPDAQVLHPYWVAPFKQIAGWASGDVLCLSLLPHAAFWTPPNWAEIALFCLIYGLVSSVSAGSFASCLRMAAWAILAAVMEVAMLAPRFFVFAKGLPKPRAFVAVLATAPPMVQDMVRLASKFKRGKVSELCHQFDWMNGTGHHPSEVSSNVTWKLVGWAAAVWCYESQERVAVTLLVSIYSLWILRQAGTLALGDWKRRLERPPMDICIPKDKVPFVVLAYQRTGSNMLVRNHLNKHPDIHMHFELFNEKAIYKQSNPGETQGAVREPAQIRARDADPAAFLEKVIEESPKMAVGFKLFPEHVHKPEFLTGLLADKRIRKVILYRENLLACAKSIMRASVTGKYIHTPLDDVPVHISPSDFQRWIDSYEHYYAFLRDRLAGQSYVAISYESLRDQPDETLQPVYALLGVKPLVGPPKLPGDLKQQSSGLACDGIANIDELCCAFPRLVERDCAGQPLRVH